MGVTFHWFKDYKVEKHENPISWVESNYYSTIAYIGDYGSTSHSYGNRSKLQDLFKKVDCEIPNIADEIFDDRPEFYIKNLLISPTVMSEKCQELLDSNYDLQGLEDRIRRVKELSDSGYYVAYDMP